MRLVRVARYFTLYFIPLFETSHLGDYVDCLGCGMKFNPTVFDIKPASQEEVTRASVRADLVSGTPLQMARFYAAIANEGRRPAPHTI